MKTYVKPELEIVAFATESVAYYGNYGYDRSMEQGPESTEEDNGGI